MEVTTLISLTLASGVLFSIGMILICRSRKAMVDYIKALIDQTEVRCSHISEELLSDVSSAYSYGSNNRQLTNDEEKCGCIKCVRIFNSNDKKS